MAFGMTGAVPLRPIVHVKKKKARNDVCGAAQAIHKLPCSTRQKRKKQEMTCAEPPKLSPLRPIAHVKKKKARNNVCGAAPSSSSQLCYTRQKGKSKKITCAELTQAAVPHTPKRK